MRGIGRLTFNNAIGFGGWVSLEKDKAEPEVALFDGRRKVASGIVSRSDKNHWIDGEPVWDFVFYYTDLLIDLSVGKKLRLECQGEQLQGSPFRTFSQSALPGDLLSDRFFFLHIPKSAGTSVRVSLRDVFSQRVTFPNEGQIHRNNRMYLGVSQMRKQDPVTLAETQLMVGHLPSAAIDLLSEKCKGFTFLREPNARAISNLMFLYDLSPHLREMPLRDVMFDVKNALHNLQTRYFADSSFQHTPYFDDWSVLDEKGFRSAKERLSTFEMIGITERLPESMDLLSRMLKVDFLKIPEVNVTTRKHRHLLTDEIIETIREWNTVDSAFYRYALDLFEQRRKELHRS